jgi:hypothetical protein
VTAPSTCDSAQSSLAAAAPNSRAVEARKNKDAMKLRRVDCMRRLDSRTAAGSYYCESHLAS